MDILHLVDRLEELISDCRAIPLTRNIIVDEDRILELIDQMRISIPDEMKKAQQITSQRDRVIAQAQEEAGRTISLAKQEAEQLLVSDAVVQAAQERAEQIINQARAATESIRHESDDYVIESLDALERELSRLLTQTRNGINKLAADRQQVLQQEQLQPNEEKELQKTEEEQED
jgi:nitrogen-specific signal transduction histidine kinase